ncbi:MAG: UxaA family hydrolase [Deltaproteobacteria bacterium]|nr:UxaA family hydrolase [Deltaproteobacteria bacterium]
MEHSNSGTDKFLLSLAPEDNVLVLIKSMSAGSTLLLNGKTFQLNRSLGLGHKIAAREIRAGENVFKYGVPIGSAVRDIRAGEHVHLHNMKSDYIPTYTLDEEHKYVRED